MASRMRHQWLQEDATGRSCQKGNTMFAILTLFSGFIAAMFLVTAATSVVNAYREAAASRMSVSRGNRY